MRILISGLITILSLNLSAQKIDPTGTWIHPISNTKLDIKKKGNNIVTKIDGSSKTNTYKKTSPSKYVYTKNSKVYIKLTNDEKLVRINENTNRKSTWERPSSSNDHFEEELANNDIDISEEINRNGHDNKVEVRKKSRNSFNNKKSYVNIGVSVISEDIGFGFSKKIPPIRVSYNRYLLDKISVGIFANYAQYEFSEFLEVFNTSFYGGGIRGVYNFELLNGKLKPYVGSTLAYYIFQAPDLGFGSESESDIFFDFIAGIRYDVNDKFAGFVETGTDYSYLTVGASYKF